MSLESEQSFEESTSQWEGFGVSKTPSLNEVANESKRRAFLYDKILSEALARQMDIETALIPDTSIGIAGDEGMHYKANVSSKIELTPGVKISIS